MTHSPHSETDQLVERVLQSIPVESLPDLGPAVVARIKQRQHAPEVAAAPRRMQRMSSWLWSPRVAQLQWRPAYAVALILLLAALPWAVRSFPGPEPAIATQVFVQFRLDAPDARQVKLVGDFTNWKTTVSLQRAENGVWSVVVPVEPGVHTYSFVVNDNEWIADPAAPAVSDGFGGRNSQLAVLVPEQGRSM